MMSPHENTEVSSSWLRGLLVAIFVLSLHGVLSQLPVPWADDLENTKKNAPITIEKFVEPEENDRRQVVQSSKALEQEEAKDKAKFWGEFKNRVKEQSQADQKGNFRERMNPAPQLPGLYGNNPPLTQYGLPSQSPNQLPDEIKRGGQTVLNTDPVFFASYVNRIGEAIYGTWARLLQEADVKIIGRGGKIPDNSYRTEIALMLNRDGELTAIQTLKSSGMPEFDEAARSAFWRTEPYRNPPTQLFKQGEDVATLEFSLTYEYGGVPHLRIIRESL